MEGRAVLGAIEAPADGIAMDGCPGDTLASASADGTALLWDVSKFKRLTLPARVLQRAELEECWKALAESEDCDALIALVDAGRFTSTVAAPAIQPRYLTAQAESEGRVDAIRLTRRIGIAETLGDFRIEPHQQAVHIAIALRHEFDRGIKIGFGDRTIIEHRQILRSRHQRARLEIRPSATILT
ncbi:MAG: hypothetical protein HC937_01690 [Aquincola sp.]|nr:hypothetical protein [Aquincola sp.]